MGKKIVLVFLFWVTIINFSYSQTKDPNVISYLFAGHCYQDGSWGRKIDYRLEGLNKSNYKGIWLGGDVCSEAMMDYSIISYIDSVMNLSNPETHWSLGNHDARLGNWEWYEELTNRKTYYSYSSNNITRIIMNTNLVPTNCEMMEEQFQIITDVCDTISQSKYLVLIMHHGIWRDIPGLVQPNVYANSNLIYWSATCDSINTTFVNTIYPKLLNVKSKGIEVICILGDMGGNIKMFSSCSDDGIWFLGCGLNHNENDDQVILFDYNINTHNLSWKFHNLDSLYLSQ